MDARFEVNTAFNDVALTKVVASCVDPHETTDVVSKPDPEIDSDEGALSVVNVAGETVATTGVVAVIVTVIAVLVPPAGAGVTTRTLCGPAVSSALGGATAVMEFGFPNVVASSVLSHTTFDAAVNPEPKTVKIVGRFDVVNALGLTPVSTGTGFTMITGIVVEPPPGPEFVTRSVFAPGVAVRVPEIVTVAVDDFVLVRSSVWANPPAMPENPEVGGSDGRAHCPSKP